MDRDVSVPASDPALPRLSEGRIPSRMRRFSLLRGELLFRYNSSLYKSDGFDMVSLASLKGQSGTMPHGIISPLSPKCKYSRDTCKTVSMRAIDEYQRRRQLRTFFKDPLHVPVGPITRARSKKIKEALNGLIQEICADSKMGHSKLGPKGDEGVLNLIQAIHGADCTKFP